MIPARSASDVLSLQKTHGNTHVQRLLAIPPAPPATPPARTEVATAGSPLELQRDVQTDRPTQKPQPKETGAGAIPWTRFQGWATKAIDVYEGGVTDGLNDFEKNVKEPASSTDWRTFALNLVGNITWALACFGTGGTAFIVSLAGIAIGAGATAAVMNEPKASFDMTRFHHHVRKAVSGEGGVVPQLKGRIVEASQAMERESGDGRWADPNQAHRALLDRMFAGSQFIGEEGGLPTVRRWAVAKQTEAELLLTAAASMPGGAPEWPYGPLQAEGVKLSLDYEAPNAMDDATSTKTFKNWAPRLKDATLEDATGLFGNMGERLTEIYGETLKQSMPVDRWPLRKSIRITVGPQDDGPAYVSLHVTAKGELRKTWAIGLSEAGAYRSYLVKGDKGPRISEDTTRQIWLDALPPLRITELKSVKVG